jgi:hypothetical protein
MLLIYKLFFPWAIVRQVVVKGRSSALWGGPSPLHPQTYPQLLWIRRKTSAAEQLTCDSSIIDEQGHATSSQT